MFLRLRKLLAVLFLLAAIAQAGAADIVQRPGVWAHDYTGRTADPAIRFGQLPNGLRYAILHNATPAGHMSLRLDIGSGSLAETRNEQGLAHFLEHMAFRGSTHVADGEMSRILARYGLGFGADLNATTFQLATVYKFDFPQAAGADIDTGLILLREIASDLTIDPAAVDAERGVVLSEERVRDTASYRSTKAMFDAWLPGQLMTERWPIGRVDVLQQATAEQLRGFYRREYRPDNAVIVAVGDFDPDVMENAILSRFADWEVTGTLAHPDLGSPALHGPTAALFSEPVAPALATVTFVRPVDNAADTDAIAARNIKRSLAARILDSRLATLSNRADPPFTGARVLVGNIARSASVTELTIDASPERWRAAMQTALGAEQRLVRFGATQAELDGAIAGRRAAYATSISQAGTRQTVALAEMIVGNAIADIVTRSPAQNAAEFDAVAASTDLTAISAALNDLFSGSGPVAFLSTPHPPEGGVDAVHRVLDSILAGSVTEEIQGAASEWPYIDFGAPGPVVDRQEIAEFGLTVVRFANGATLTVKPMPANRGRVAISVAFGRGRLGLSPALAHAYWLLSTFNAFINGGTGKLSIDDIRRASELHSSPLRFVMDDRNFSLRVHTGPTNFDFALQLCAAYLSDPGFRAQAVDRAKSIAVASMPLVEGSEEKVLAQAESRALHDGDPRWTTIPTAADIAATRPDDLRALLEPPLHSGPPHIVVVGDVDADQAIMSVARTIGALPRVELTEPPLAAPVHFPATGGEALKLTHQGRADQATAVLAWPTQGFFSSPAEARALDVAAAIIGQRLVEGLRQTDGATYSPRVRAVASDASSEYGYLAATVEIPPAKIALFCQRLDSIIADLQQTPVSEDELRRAKQPLAQRRIRQMQENDYWLNTLTAERPEPPVRDMLRTRVSGLVAVTAENVREVATRFLAGPPFMIQVTSSGSSVALSHGSRVTASHAAPPCG